MGSPTLKNESVRRILAKNLRGFLRERQISENEFAARCGVSQKHINNMTNARTGCGIDAIYMAAQELRIPAWLLLVPNASEYLDTGTKAEQVLKAMFPRPKP